MTTKSVPLCKDCKHYIPCFPFVYLEGCEIAKVDPVNGHPKYCGSARRYGEPCGPDGKLFDRRIGWLERILNSTRKSP